MIAVALPKGWPPPVPDESDAIMYPYVIARPLLFSAQLMLVTACVGLWRHEYVAAVISVFLWLTSLLHWSAPRFSSWARTVDLFAVACAFAWSSYLAVARTRNPVWEEVWFVGFACVAVLFTWNETIYYLKVQRAPVVGVDLAFANACCNLAHAPLGSPERNAEYHRNMWMHLICVHVLSNGLVLVLLLDGLEPRGA
jgi:hypothetical protein